MQQTTGQKIIGIAVGIAGLVAVFLLGKWIATQIYDKPDEEVGTEVQVEVELATARTEEEMEALYHSIKEASVLSGEPGRAVASRRGIIRRRLLTTLRDRRADRTRLISSIYGRSTKILSPGSPFRALI